METSANYEPRYLGGIVLFNRRDYFEAHEVWESLWLDSCVGDDRRFVQGLIQSAVGLYHFGNRNYSGANKLYKSARAYMERYPPVHLGLDVQKFWSDMERCFLPILPPATFENTLTPNPALLPMIQLCPDPKEWPDPAAFLHDEDD
jgi:hypothetical protein